MNMGAEGDALALARTSPKASLSFIQRTKESRTMKKFIIIGAAAAALAVPVTASAMPYSQQPGYDNASYCGAGHGTFGYLGENGSGRHDLGQGDSSPTGMVKLGADGPATGLANSTLCSKR
jgi:hypothetical protein